MGVSAKVVCDSSFGNTRLITLEVEFHRFILPEVNTHRSLSRNYQSSRAVPVKQMIEQVRNDPAMPVHWGKNQAGMVANDEVSGFTREQSILRWQYAAQGAAECAEAFNEAGVHKQIVNRLLEPFMWTKGVITGTYDAWQAFLKLRAHRDAQPEIQALAFKIRDAIEDSVPTELKEGEWHLPYVNQIRDCFGNQILLTKELEPVTDNSTRILPTMSTEDAVKVSASMCAQVSYRKADDSLEKALKIYDMLNLPENGVYPEDPPHFSPTEHLAMAKNIGNSWFSGNFYNLDFIQYRKLLERGIEEEVIQ